MIEYKTILIDPPWKLCSGGSKGLAVHTHYPVQTIQEIKDTVSNWIQENPVASEAHLYLWTVNSYSAGYSRGILDALDLCDHIGFRPITNLVWAKPQSRCWWIHRSSAVLAPQAGILVVYRSRVEEAKTEIDQN